jgi:ribosomal protein S21
MEVVRRQENLDKGLRRFQKNKIVGIGMLLEKMVRLALLV